MVHWAEGQEGRKKSAHSDFITQPLRLYGLEGAVDVMIEAKGGEQAVLRCWAERAMYRPACFPNVLPMKTRSLVKGEILAV